MAGLGFGIKQVVRKATLLAGLTAAMTLAHANAANATSYTVTTTSDTSSSGQCTLRDAINAANGSVTPGSSCSATGTGTDDIAFGSGVTGTITLTSSLPAILSLETLTIQGPTTPPGITVDGASTYQVMSVNSGATLNIYDLTIAHGKSNPQGGGISNSGTLMVTNCTFSGNSAGGSGGAIENQGKATITNSSFSGNNAGALGGAIDQRSNNSLTVTNSSFSGGSASDGGAVNGSGTFTNTTFSNNSAIVGGAIFGGGTFTDCTFSGNKSDDGGAILDQSGELTIDSSTFSGNSTTGNGGAILNVGAAAIKNSTFSGNSAFDGGAIFGGGTFTNCTFSGNKASQGGSIFNTGGGVNLKGTILASSTSGGNCGGTPAVTDDGYNLSDDDSCAFSATGSQNSVMGLALGALMNNGGLTETLAITSSSSPAAATIPAASCTDLATDQRGYGRPVAGFCSAGAYQLGGPPPGALTVMPTSLSFPDTFVGVKSAAKQVTVENTSAVSVDLDSIKVSTGNFAVDSSQCASPLLPSTSCTLNVIFNPTASGPLTDTLSISDNVPGSPQTVALSGTGLPPPVDCSKAKASTPSLTAMSPFTFYPENVTGVTDTIGAFSISITGVEQNTPIINFPPLFCPNARILGTTAFVRTTTPLGGSGMLYGIAFTATDKSSGLSCKGTVPVCVQGVLNHGKPCTGTAVYDATKCR